MLAVLFVEIETEILCETLILFVWLEAKRLMAKSGHQDADRLGKFGSAGAFALGNCKGAQIDGDQGDDWDRTRAQNSSAAEEKRRTARRASRARQTLPRNLEKRESTETGKTSDQYQGDLSSIAKQENPEAVLRLLPRLLFNSCGTVGPCPSRESSLDRIVEKLENGLCW